MTPEEHVAAAERLMSQLSSTVGERNLTPVMPDGSHLGEHAASVLAVRAQLHLQAAHARLALPTTATSPARVGFHHEVHATGDPAATATAIQRAATRRLL